MTEKGRYHIETSPLICSAKVLNRLLRLSVISKDIKNKRSQEIFISLFLHIPGK